MLVAIINCLQSISQAQKEELDRALRAAAQKGFTDKEHERMKEELSVLPSLKEELEALKALVSELTQLTGTPLLFSNTSFLFHFRSRMRKRIPHFRLSPVHIWPVIIVSIIDSEQKPFQELIRNLQRLLMFLQPSGKQSN